MKFGTLAMAFAGLGAAIIAAVVAMPRAEPPLVTIDTLITHHAAFAGKRLRVRGFLSQCRGENCVLTSTPFHIRDMYAWYIHGGRMLSIGPDEHFDKQTSGFDNRAVVIRARFRDDCFHPAIACLDRAPTLQPLGWHPILPDEEI